MSPLPMFLALGDARVLQVRHERAVLLVPAPVERSMTSDELLRKFAAVRQRRERLGGDRATCHCQRFGATRQKSTEGSAETVTETMRRLARGLYSRIDTVYWLETADNVVDETLNANEWPFTEDGRLFVEG